MLSAAFIALGSNLGDRAAHLGFALRGLAGLPETVLRAQSRIYETRALGPGPQGSYLNAVAQIETGLSPGELLRHTRAIEDGAGRVRGAQRWGPRTLDLDLLLYGELELCSPDLVIPHPRLTERRFVLEPLAELAADFAHPAWGATVAVLARRAARAAGGDGAVWLWRGAPRAGGQAGCRPRGPSPPRVLS